MWFNRKFSLISVFFATLFVVAEALCSTPFSQYGMIQNVRDYSSNPFYNPNSATVFTPNIISAGGPALKAEDCQTVVQTLIELECATRNYCKNTKLTDIRPTLMIRLSGLPTHNYASTCSGYIDYLFNQYIKNHSTGDYLVPHSGTFPSTPGATNVAPAPTTATKTWQQEYNERVNELHEFHKMTDTTTYNVGSADFPTVFEDLPFTVKNDIKRQGYEPYKNAQPYEQIHVEVTRKNTPAKNSQTSAATSNNDVSSIENCIEELENNANQAKQYATEAANLALRLNNDNTVSNTVINSQMDKADRLADEYKEAKAKSVNAPCYCTLNSPLRNSFLQQRNIKCSSSSPDQLAG